MLYLSKIFSVDRFLNALILLRYCLCNYANWSFHITYLRLASRYNLNEVIHGYPQSVWPDWTIFESSWPKKLLTKVVQNIVDYWASLKYINLCQNCFGYYLGNFWKHLGNFLTPTSGPTGRNLDRNEGLKIIDLISSN